MVWGFVVGFHIGFVQEDRVSVGCARGKLTLTKTETSRPQPMSTDCSEPPDTCEAAPGRSTDMPQMLLSLTHLRSNVFFKKFMK